MKTRKIVIAAISLALCLILPFITGQIPQIGQALAPMHIPVLICAFLIGGPWAAVVGFIAPLLRYLLFGMPPIFPMGISMAFEMATYGLVAGLLYKALAKKTSAVFIALITAMLAGRMVWGIVRYILSFIAGPAFSFEMFLAGAFVTAVPGIILHLILVPIVVIAIQKAKILKD